jgi:hypothetical protein
VSAAAFVVGRRDAVDATAAALMVGLTLSWGLNYVAAKISYASYDSPRRRIPGEVPDA